MEKKVLVLVNPSKDKDLIVTKKVISYLKEKDCDVYVQDDDKSFLNEKAFNANTIIDFALVLGGDGTFLNKMHTFSEYDFPYFGINLGRVGCLTEATIDDYEEKITAILDNNFHIEKRNILSYKIIKQDEDIEGIAFNEVCISRGNLFKMLRINMNINGINKTSFYADGVVVATPTGSSAYNLSCGGPLLFPTTNNFVITPISPQFRCITSLVVNDTEEITIDISEENKRQLYGDDKPIVVIDGKTMIKIDEDTKIILNKSYKALKIIKVSNSESLFEATFKVALSSKELFNK